VEVVVERDRVVELIDGEAVLGKAWDVRLGPKLPAASTRRS